MSGDDDQDMSYYEDEDAMMSVDPAYSQPNQSVYPEQNQSSVNPEQYYSEEDQMCVDPGASRNSSNMSEFPYSGGQCSWDYSGGMSSADNFYSDSGGTLMSGGGSYLCEYPAEPHLVLDVDDDIVTGEEPELDLTSMSEEGVINHERLNIGPGQVGHVFWNTLNATGVALNGEEVDTSGSKLIYFDESLRGNFWPYEVVAWNGSMENSVSRYIEVYMIGDFGIDVEAPIKWKTEPWPILQKCKYVKGSIQIEVTITGKLTHITGETGVVGKWAEGVAGELSRDYKWGPVQFTPKLEFKVPIEVGGNDEDENVWLELGGAIEVSTEFIPLEGHPVKVAGEISFNALRVSYIRSERKWKGVAGTVGIKGGGATKLIDFAVPGWGTVSGTLAVALTSELEPNWPEIIKAFVQRYGATLGTKSYAIVGAVAGVLTSTPVLIAAGVGTLAISVKKWGEAGSLRLYTEEYLPAYAKALRRGVSDGAHGRAHRSGTVAVEDETTAYQAGVAAGTTIRLGLEENGENFDTRDDKDEVIDGVYRDALAEMKRRLWISKAAPMSEGTWLDSDHADLRMQQHWWTVIIGGRCPADMGGQYIKDWRQYRVRPDDISDSVTKLPWYDGRW